MSTQTHDEDALYRLEYDDEIDAAIYTWKDYATGDRFKRGANVALEYFRNNDVSKLIVDTSGIEAHDEADQVWLEEEWTPSMIDAGMAHNALVHQSSVISEMDTEDVVDRMQHLDYEVYMTDSMRDARNWMAER